MAILLRPIELAVNQALKQDPETQERLNAFENRVIVIHIKDWQQYLHVSFHQSAIKLTHNDEENADLLITANAMSLLKLAKHPEHLFSNEIHIHGNVQFAKQLQDVLNGFDFDWEQQIANVTGDVIAQPLSYAIKQSFSWLNATQRSLSMSFSEYLREEAHILPDKIQIDDFMSDVDKIKADIDRLEARINRLESHH
jgi:ubiquinone biosynthesis accessory factor UbiJ